jgi:hypothetical protein
LCPPSQRLAAGTKWRASTSWMMWHT